jgi:hypothetical protein
LHLSKTDVFEATGATSIILMVSDRTKTHEHERLLLWAWKAEQLAAALHA